MSAEGGKTTRTVDPRPESFALDYPPAATKPGPVRADPRFRRHIGDRLDELLDCPPEILAQWPMMLAQMVEVVEATLRREPKTGKDPDPAVQARAVVAAIAFAFGGGRFKIPGAAGIERALLHMRIYREWDGRNIGALCRQHRLDRATVYRIIQSQRRLRQARLAGRDLEHLRGLGVFANPADHHRPLSRE